MEHIHLGGSSPASQDSASAAEYGEGGGFVIQGNLNKYVSTVSFLVSTRIEVLTRDDISF
jgi:hypothetical protein